MRTRAIFAAALVYCAASAQGFAANENVVGKWSQVYSLPMVPVGGSILPDGKVALWSGDGQFSFTGSGPTNTHTAIFDPATGTNVYRAFDLGHNMFCPGTTQLADGRILINGGSQEFATTIYDPAANTWRRDDDMNVGRGYNANTILADGSVLTLGGSWDVNASIDKIGEVWTAGSGWRRLDGMSTSAMQIWDDLKDFGKDSHYWLKPTGNGKVLYAGPHPDMQWLDTAGAGSVRSAGRRGDDSAAINGIAVMYEQGRILKAGGATRYDEVVASNRAYRIDADGPVSVTKLSPMVYARGYANSVVLPDGKVFIVGGQTYLKGFTDINSVMPTEIWDPATGVFSLAASIAVPRNYHSIAMLLPDGRVLSGGGGLCGNCSANHPDVQIWSPPYLFDAAGNLKARPTIVSAPSELDYGRAITVTTGADVASFAMVRFGSTTHTVNNDQRRLKLTHRKTGTNTYEVDVPTNPGWMLPGNWMLFALDAAGTPSRAKVVRVRVNDVARLTSPGDLAGRAGTAMDVAVAATPLAGAVTYSGSGLPAGLAVNPSTGRITGTPTQSGFFKPAIRASAAGKTVSVDFTLDVAPAPTPPPPPPPPSVTALSVGTATVGAPVTYSPTVANGSGATFSWSFGDGGSTSWSSSPNATHTFAAAGTYTVTLSLRDSTGNPATPYAFTQKVNPVPQPSVVSLAVSTAVAGDQVDYAPVISNGGGASFAWNFGDGASTGWSSSPNAAHTFAAAGTYTVTLSLRDSTGKAVAPHVFTQRVDPVPPPPPPRVASLHVATATAGRSVTYAPTIVDGAGATFRWTFGDGGSTGWSSSAGATHTFAAAGSFTVTLAMRDSAGGAVPSHVFSQAVAIPPGRPEVDVEPRVEALFGQDVSVQASATDADGDAVTFSASGLPPGLAIDADSGLISGKPTATGDFRARVTATDVWNLAGFADVDFEVTFGDLPHVGDLAVPPVAVGGTARYRPTIVNGDGASFSWSFGDGTPDTEFADAPAADHVFRRAGIHTVTLLMRASDGRMTTFTAEQAVTAAGPLGATASATTGMAVETVSATVTRVWSVNEDNGSVSVHDARTGRLLREIATGATPTAVAVAPDRRVWVVNRDAATVSIVDPRRLRVVRTIRFKPGSRPYDVVFRKDRKAIVTLEALGRVAVVSPAGKVLKTRQVGASPRHLAYDERRNRVLATRFVTAPAPGESTTRVSTPAGYGGEVYRLSGKLGRFAPVVLSHDESTDSEASGRGLPNYLGTPALAPDGRFAWVPSKKDNVKRGLARDGRNLDFQNTVRAIVSKIDLATGREVPGARVDLDNSGIAAAALFHPSGAYLFVALTTSRQVAVVDPVGARELFRFPVGRAPMALALSPDGGTLFVQNMTDRTISLVDLSPLLGHGEKRVVVAATPRSVVREKLPSTVLRGKQFFYDAADTRLARDGYLSCAVCHDRGEADGRTWDFTGFGEGVRNTISLEGRGGLRDGFLHWSANFDEIQDFEGQIRGFAGGSGLMADAAFNAGTRSQPLGARKAGVSRDLDALAAYVSSLRTPPVTPFGPAGKRLAKAEKQGLAVFRRAGCVACHQGPRKTISGPEARLRNIGTIDADSGRRLGGPLRGIDVPTLRGLWATAPYLHDGSARTIEDAIRRHRGVKLKKADIKKLAAYLRSL